MKTFNIRRKNVIVTILLLVFAIFPSFRAFGQTGNTMQDPIILGTLLPDVPYSDVEDTRNFTCNYVSDFGLGLTYTRPSNDVFYRFTLDGTMEVVIDHSGSVVNDTYIYLLDANGKYIWSDNDNSSSDNYWHAYLKRTLSSGTYYVVSKGYGANDNGEIKTTITAKYTVEGHNMAHPVDVGILNTGDVYSDTKNLSDFGDKNSYGVKDVWYKFTLNTPMNVKINLCGTILKISGTKTYICLYDALETPIADNNGNAEDSYCSDTRLASVEKILTPGVYYVLSEAKCLFENININITGTSLSETQGVNMDNMTAVGDMGGSLNVTNSGAATYTIPIETPQGVHGVKPSVAIAYNSWSGNSVAGFGCGLSGISVISRTAKTIYHDGGAKGIAYAADDAYALDGHRLILYSGVAGQNGAEYYPEGDPYTKVTIASGTAGLYFQVLGKSGAIRRYGCTADSRQTFTSGGASIVNAWYLNYTQEPGGGSFINYAYEKSDNCMYLKYIDYGNDGSTPGMVNNRVAFTYEPRPDTIRFMLKDAKGFMTKRLSNITTQTNSQTYREYLFSYDNSDQFSRLSSVREKNGAGESLNPVQLAWNHLPEGNGITAYTPAAPTDSLPLFAMFTSDKEDIITAVKSSPFSFSAADLNGDGLEDFVLLSTPSEMASANAIVFWSSLDSVNNPGQVRFLSQTALDLGANAEWVGSTDFNGDGINEMVTMDASGFRVSGQSFNATYPGFTGLSAVADLNNDGKGEIVCVSQSLSGGQYPAKIISQSGEVSFSLNLPAKPAKLFVQDFDGDGMSDLMVLYDTGYTLFKNQGQGLSAQTFSNDAACKVSGNSVTDMRVVETGDFNGDGLPDFVMNAKMNNNVYIAFNNGDGTFNKQFAYTLDLLITEITSENDYDFSCKVFDFNADGKDDVVFTTEIYHDAGALLVLYGTTYWLQSNGSTLEKIKSANSNDKNDASGKFYTLGDFNGDGVQELMNYGYDCYNGTTSTILRIYQNPQHTAGSGKITGITDEYGNNAKINYNYLTRDKVYSKDDFIFAYTVYPIVDFHPAWSVVESTILNEKKQSYEAKIDYHYKGAKQHLQGLGFLGMTSSASNNTTTGVVSEQCQYGFFNDYAIPEVTIQRTAVNGKADSTATFYSATNQAKGKYMALPKQKIQMDMYGNTATSFYNFDAYGNMLKDSTVWDAGMYRVTASDNFITVADGTAPNKPQRVTVTQKHADDANPFVQKTAFVYDLLKGNVLSKTENCETPSALTTGYSYDNWGNLSSRTISGAGVSSLTAYMEYDDTKRFQSKIYTVPTSNVAGFEYDLWGNLLKAKDETPGGNALATVYTYDAWGNKLSVVTPDKRTAVSVIGHGDGSDPMKCYFTYVQGTGAAPLRTWYDALKRQTMTETIGATEMPNGTVNYYNAKGLLFQAISAPGNLVLTNTYTYDNFGRKKSETSPSGQLTEYRYGNRRDTVSSNGFTSIKTYDAWGNPKTVTETGGGSITYTYNSTGKPATINANGAISSMTYDLAGNQTSLTDANSGLSSYTYDALGRICTQTDARGNKTVKTYDVLGRDSCMTINGATTSYTYGTASYNRFLPVTIQSGGNSIQYAYDIYGRITQEKQQQEGEAALTFSYAYRPDGKLQSATCPEGVMMQQDYDRNGYLVQSLAAGNLVWKLTGTNGEATAIQKGNNTTAYMLRNAQGMLTNLWTLKGNSLLRNLEYNFDGATGNLLSRNGMFAQPENFSYDALDRLTGVSGGQGDKTIAYQANGNIASASDLGQYSYSPNKPHAVEDVDDSNGLIPFAGQTISYNAFGKADTIRNTLNGDAYELAITYGPDQQRWKSVLKKNGIVEKTIIFAGNYEQIRENNTVKHFYYIQGPQGLAGVYVKQTGQTSDKLYYAEVDHLGSILRLTDNANKEVFAATYDAWGNQTVTNNTFDFHRGYTGHEHLPEFGLINMNGRMYDPSLRRMLSPDAYVQSPLFSQSYNRYSYCVNNPLKFTDPTGEDITVGDHELPDLIVSAPRIHRTWTPGLEEYSYRFDFPDIPLIDMRHGVVMEESMDAMMQKMPMHISLLTISPINYPSALTNPFASPPPPPAATAILVGTMTGESQESNAWMSPNYMDIIGLGWTDSSMEQNVTKALSKAKYAIKVQRIYESENATLSNFYAYGPIPYRTIEGYILEPGGPSTKLSGQDKRIPSGIYNINPYNSLKFKNVYIISGEQVSSTRGILIHSGNYHYDTLGCFLPGSYYGIKDDDYYVGNSRSKLNELRNLFQTNQAVMIVWDINNK